MHKIYTLYTQSHKVFYDEFFKPSLRNLYSKDQVAISVAEIDGYMGTGQGSFRTESWVNSLQLKTKFLYDIVSENYGNTAIFIDCDVQFFKPFIDNILQKLSDCDFVGQSDRQTICTGVFACKCNDAVLGLMKSAKDNFNQFNNDQLAINHYKHLVKYKLLDDKQYYTIGNFFTNKDGTNVWDNSSDFTLPSEIMLHHANYVVGVENKLKLLSLVKAKYHGL